MTVSPAVVLVDDSEDLRSLVRMYLRRSKRLDVIAEGASGRDAIALAIEHQPDLMLLDVSMPLMDGLEALPQVISASPHTKVVMFTGFVQHGLRDKARELGATDLLEKSIPIGTLADTLLGLLGTSGGPDAATVGESAGGAPAAGPGSATVLDEHRERFREVFDEAAIGMGTMTLTGRLVRANKAMGALVQRSPESLVGSSYDDLIEHEDGTSFADLLRQIVADGNPVVVFERGLARVSRQRRVRATLAPVRDSSGEPLYLFAQFQDVSEQWAVERALRLSEERFRLLVETLADQAILTLDPDGLVQSWNLGAERMTGYPAEEIVGQHFRRFYPSDQQHSGHTEHELELALRDGHYEEEGWRVRKDGSEYWANVILATMRDPDGRVTGFAKIVRDVSERRRITIEKELAAAAAERANVELAQLNERLSAAAEEQAQFLATTAHELRTPITILGGTAELLRDEDDLTDDERHEMLASMTANVGRLRRLLDDLLTAARLDARAINLDLAPVPLAPVIDRAIETLNRRVGATVATTTGVDPSVTVKADAERLGQIFDNLVNNAANHGRPPVSIEVRTVGEMAEIRVVDSGPGVPAELRDRLFDRYVTAARSGTGLGLFIVRELAVAHGGQARYEHADRPTFVISLPLATAAGDENDVSPAGHVEMPASAPSPV